MSQLDMFKGVENPLPIHDSWFNLCNKHAIDRALDTFESTNDVRSCGGILFPDKGEVFRALNLPVEKVRVVILGQDPYHNGNATGLAFSCKYKTSPSLKQIILSIAKYYKRSGKYSTETLRKLEHLPDQGVLLLNTILTVRKGEPLSHQFIGWEDFTKDLIEQLSKKRKGVIFLLWGKQAKKYRHLISDKMSIVLEHVHPAYAARNNSDWNCNHFSIINNHFKNKGEKEIIWI